MSDIKDGGPAFPCDPFIASKPGHEDVAKRLAEGMTLRDYFAAKALPVVAAGQCEAGAPCLAYANFLNAAKDAYRMADAMIRAREAS